FRPARGLLLTELLRSSFSCSEVYLKVANEFPALEFSPDPCLLNRPRFLKQYGLFLDAVSGTEIVNEVDMEQIIFEPLSKFTISEFLALQIEHGRKAMQSGLNIPHVANCRSLNATASVQLLPG